MSHTAHSKPLVDRLRQWQSTSSPLCLDLRSSEAFRNRRIQPATHIYWKEIDANWYTLPATVVPFAVILPIEAEEVERIRQQPQTLSQAATCQPTPQSDSTSEADHPSDAPINSAASSSATPIRPSNPAFQFSHASLLNLLRFYGWQIPDDWVFVANDEFFAAAAQVPSLRVLGESDAIESSILFAPSPILELHFTRIHHDLHTYYSAQRSSSSSPSHHESKQPKGRDTAPETEERSSKQPRSDTALSVNDSVITSSAPSLPSSSTNAATSSSPIVLRCLDVACGSGRDMVWLLWHSRSKQFQKLLSEYASSSSSTFALNKSYPFEWHVHGVDLAPSSLERAKQLAKSLGVEQFLTGEAARINQSNGEWKCITEKDNQANEDNNITPNSAASVETIAGSASSVTPSEPSDVSQAAIDTTPSKLGKGQLERREKRKQKELKKAAAAMQQQQMQHLSSTANSTPVTPAFLHETYDLIVIVRFLSRVFIRNQLLPLLKVGGFFLLSTFIDDGVTVFESPANPAFRIHGTQEVKQWVKEIGHLEIVQNTITKCEDGRPISDCLLRRVS